MMESIIFVLLYLDVVHRTTIYVETNRLLTKRELNINTSGHFESK